MYIDALMVKIRDGSTVRNKACYLAIGVDCAGIKHVLGIWVQPTEGAKFWLQVCTELRNRGVRDVLIACCDGLTGLPEAIETVWPHTTVQTCTVHLIRQAMKFVSYKDRRAMAAALKDIYTAATAEAAETALLVFADSELGRRYPSSVAVFERAWDRFTPFFAFPPAVRKIIYTTNAIESFNFQIRKIIKNRGHFPTDDARDQADLARDRRHRGQTRPPTRRRGRQGQKPAGRPRSARRRRRGQRLETSPQLAGLVLPGAYPHR